MDRSSSEISIVGGGLAGLVAAIRVAEGGGHAVLHEAQSRLGGRARSERGDYRANFGPHALYHGPFARWLAERSLLPPLVAPRLSRFRLARGNRILRLPLALLPAQRSLKRTAPVDRDYRSWAREFMSERAAEAAVGFASLPTFHADPGSLSAAFVHERIQRSFARPAVGYVIGGWVTLVERLAARARELGVTIHTGAKCGSLPSPPVIVATDLPAAARLLGERALDWPGARTVMLDLSLRYQRRDPFAILDLDRRAYVSCYSAYDSGLAPEGERLFQACVGLGPEERVGDGVARIEALLDLAHSGWRERCVWRRSGISEGGAGAADPPGTRWQDRPAIDRGDGVFLAGDRVAAPGILSEVAFESGVRAATAALGQARAARVFGCPPRGFEDPLPADGPSPKRVSSQSRTGAAM